MWGALFKKHLRNYYSTQASIYISPEVHIFMKCNWSQIFLLSSIFSCFTSVFFYKKKKKKLLFIWFHILHPHPLCKKQLPKNATNLRKIGISLDRQTPSQNKWEWETYCSYFLIHRGIVFSSLLWAGKGVEVLSEGILCKSL